MVKQLTLCSAHAKLEGGKPKPEGALEVAGLAAVLEDDVVAEHAELGPRRPELLQQLQRQLG
eukprot:scaffold146315_cov43-Prasinocladus_malaysianus.AAC.1